MNQKPQLLRDIDKKKQIINSMKKVILLLICLNVTLLANAQQNADRLPPKWITKEVPHRNDAYLYVKTYGEGASLDEARQKSFINLATTLEHERGLVISSQLKYHSKLERNTYTSSKDFEVQCSENGKEIVLNCSIVDEFIYRNDIYSCYTLYSVANQAYPNRPGDTIMVTNKYGAKGLMSVIPGLGQFYKHHYLKGGLILGGSILLTGGIIFTHMTYKDYRAKIQYTDNIDVAMIYDKRSDHFKTGRNICIGALAALYVYNLIDACVTPGARYVKFVKSDKRGNTYAFMPTASLEGVPMAAASITF